MAPPTLDDEVSFLSGVSADGTLELDSFAAWNPDTNPADYSGGYTNAYKWGGNTAGTAGGTVYYYFNPASSWSSTEQQFLAAGLALWSDIANVSFVLTTNSAQAGITFTRGSDGKADTTTSASGQNGAGLTGGTTLYALSGATVSIDTSVAGFGPISNFQNYGGYPIDALVHEEGHAIGLGHAGPYNGTVDSTSQQFSPYDTRLWSIMSYISPQTTSAEYYSQYPVSGTNWGSTSGYARVPTTWMPADILAAQRLYGLPTTTPLSGGQTFGFNSNVAGPSGIFFDFTRNTTPVVTLWDEGANNTLDLSGYSLGSTVNLNSGAFSSCDGMVNNICIATGTAIDKFVGGSGNDFIAGNNDGDYIDGGGGNDTIIGGSGNDTLVGNAGSNTINGHGGNNTLKVSGQSTSYSITYNAGHRVTVQGPGEIDMLANVQYVAFLDQTIALAAGIVVSPPADFNADGNSDFLWQNDSGQAAIWLMSGTSVGSSTVVGPNPGTSWHVKGSGDFNGDGDADILWQNDSGQAAIWQMNGTSLVTGPTVGSNPGTSWHVKGAGDFNGDGDADILWQNDSGQAGVWLMNGAIATNGTNVGSNPGPSWHIKGAGDFNGDGDADILWQNDSGQAAIWLMNGTTETTGALVGSDPGTSWHVRGAGDFDGNGSADILWQNDSGQAAIWLMNGTTVLSSAIVGSNPGPAWQVVGAGDINGDGISDILWQNINGQAGAWLMSGTNVIASTTVGSNPGTAWHMIAASA